MAVSLTVVLPNRPPQKYTAEDIDEVSLLGIAALCTFVLFLFSLLLSGILPDMHFDLCVLSVFFAVWAFAKQVKIVLNNHYLRCWDTVHWQDYAKLNLPLRTKEWPIAECRTFTRHSGVKTPQEYMYVAVAADERMVIGYSVPMNRAIFPKGTPPSPFVLPEHATVRFNHAEYDETTGMPNLHAEWGVIITL